MKMKKLLATGILLSLLTPFCLAGDKNQPPKPAHSVPELQQQIEKILKDSHTPGVSVAIVHRDGPEWVAGRRCRRVRCPFHPLDSALRAFLDSRRTEQKAPPSR
jgi:hypothetical protein